MRRHLFLTALPALALLAITESHAHLATLGYYRFPAIWHDTIVFTAEGDLWRVKTGGGVAERLTTHPALESSPAVSPDGTVVAFSANYEGPTEVYTISLNGGTPDRQTWDGEDATVVGWTKAGEIIYSTGRFSTLPNAQIARLDPRTHTRTLVPLAQASDGDFDETGATLFFTRLPFQGSHTRRYRGGTAQAIWKYTGDGEAVPLTADYAGTSRRPMVWNRRVYFLSDRDGVMNLWSMDTNGRDLRQHTKHVTYDVQSPSLSEGRVAYQLGADLHVYDIAADRDATVPITLVSDFDQLRERWIKDPSEWITAAHISPTGDRVAMTARGQLFVIPAGPGRIVETTRNKAVRYREARFFADGKSLLALSDESGEVEFWKVPANGVGKGVQLTSDAKVLRWDGIASPDGKLIAHFDKDQQLWVYDVEKASQKRVAVSADGDFGDVRWSPDSQWLAYTAPEPNQLTRLWLYGVKSGASTAVTSDRYDSDSPAWSPDGKWLYFLSDRHFDSIVRSPWGSRQPEPFFDKRTQIFHVSLTPGLRSPFQPDDELYVAPKEEDRDKDKEPVAPATPAAVDLRGIETRLLEVPIPPGNYKSLDVDGKRLYFISYDTSVEPKRTLETFPIAGKKAEVETFLSDVRDYELSLDRKKVMVRTTKDIYVVDSGAKAPTELAKSAIPLKDWAFSFDPREEWHQMFDEAWRLERDYFYDRGMHGLDWLGIRAKYLPLVDRVTDRSELSDALAQMVSELSALHIFVTPGDVRHGPDAVQLASLGATFVRDQGAGGLRVSHIYRSDPDRPDRLAPLSRAGVEVAENDVITTVNGISALSVSDLGQLVRNKAGKQVLLEVKAKGTGPARQVVIVPISMNAEQELRYDEWEYTRRLAVEKATDNHVGYIHLRAMGPANMAEWEREFYPVFTRDGLIIDVRHTSGGNIDSWVLEKLVRKAWFYWQPRIGHPFWNMQGAFRGHIVVLCNEFTASDGEAFTEGFRRLGLGTVIGTRTWGGEIWLSASNRLVDKGIATAAELGVYGPEGDWLIEGHGVDPDISVDNPPHAAFGGSDPQLDHAIAYLKDEIARKTGHHSARAGVPEQGLAAAHRQAGEAVSANGFIGPNGSGKSTTLRMIMNIFLPDEGEILVFGKHSHSPVRDEVGYLPEERGLYRRMTVRRVLRYYGQLKGKPLAHVDMMINRWLERMKLAAWADKKVEALSKGMAQKVQFISAIVANPKLLILDEPFSGLDPINADALRDAVLELRRQGTTIVFSTHDMPAAERLCDRIFMIFKGHKVLDGSLDDIQSNHGQVTIRVRTPAGAAGLRTMPEVESVLDHGNAQDVRLHGDPQAFLVALTQRGPVYQFEIAKPSLHDIFVRIAQPTPDDLISPAEVAS